MCTQRSCWTFVFPCQSLAVDFSSLFLVFLCELVFLWFLLLVLRHSVHVWFYFWDGHESYRSPWLVDESSNWPLLKTCACTQSSTVSVWFFFQFDGFQEQWLSYWKTILCVSWLFSCHHLGAFWGPAVMATLVFGIFLFFLMDIPRVSLRFPEYPERVSCNTIFVLI